MVFKKHFGYRFLGSVLLGIMACSDEPNNEIPPETPVFPPFTATTFLDSDILTESDPTVFTGLSYIGQALRTMFDRRVNDWVTLEPFLFNAGYQDGLSIEVQVNPEFLDVDTAEVLAQKYARAIGQLPRALRRDIETVWIHQGTELFGGGNNNILIHTGQASLYEDEGILEEILVHEAAHTSLDADHAGTSGWLSAQEADGNFISTYAKDNPTREDMAETFLMYLAVRFLPERIDTSLQDIVLNTIPNRMAYLDRQDFSMYPIE
ncbi:MAG: hypothetical protein AAGA86_06700 [Bacteroidota bacterium]